MDDEKQKKTGSRAFCILIAVMLLFALLGAWAVVDGAREYRNRTVLEVFARGGAQERVQ